MKSSLSVESVIEALRQVQDPELKQDLVSLNMIKDVTVDGDTVSFTIELTTPACPLKDVMQKDCEAVLKPLGVKRVRIEWGSRVRKSTSRAGVGGNTIDLEGVKNVVLVASGKGGVGKSTVAANLAIALAREGAQVGLLDADLYGPSIPTMFGTYERPVSADEKRVEPISAHGIDLMSIGFFVAPEQAMIWRGPILSGTILQFLRDVNWGNQDYLIVDLPPGTGDVQLSIAQNLRVTGAVMVTTPQELSLADVVRAKAMFDQVKVPVLGVIENMSYFVCPNCGTRHEIFAGMGGKSAAERLNAPFLGGIPLDTGVCIAGDSGVPTVVREPDSEVSQAFFTIARNLAGKISVHAVESGKKRGLFSKDFG